MKCPRMQSLRVQAGVWGVCVWTWACPCMAPAAEPAAGVTQAIYDGTLSLPVAGIVVRCARQEGEFVELGDLLLELDSTLEQLEVKRRRLIVESRRMEWEALQRLYEQNSISVKKEELEKARTEYAIAQTELQIAEEQLRRRRLVAPCAGYVAEVLPEEGEAVQAYQPVIRLVDPRKIRFVVNLEPARCGSLHKDQQVLVELESLPKPVRLAGTIAYISPVVDAASGLRRVEIRMDNPDAAIAPGVTGRLIFETPALR
ncbi:MAG: efflux RND transporter periplasmic adaptor subunit [Verrucomicrobiota bacterium]|nr:efflux RND transporter periplasmic adaptor subunit [Limisphaera sp.]MDW8381419.1 efflux RND transporter periplasmic adaptor subunit [Verrucomicrobiota bacterium]